MSFDYSKIINGVNHLTVSCRKLLLYVHQSSNAQFLPFDLIESTERRSQATIVLFQCNRQLQALFLVPPLFSCTQASGDLCDSWCCWVLYHLPMLPSCVLNFSVVSQRYISSFLSFLFYVYAVHFPSMLLLAL